jgi:hypothetical protein
VLAGDTSGVSSTTDVESFKGARSSELASCEACHKETDLRIIPIHPDDVDAEIIEATDEPTRRTFGHNMPSRRLFGHKMPSRRTFGRRTP